MSRSDEEYLAQLRKHATDTRTLLANSQKSERECMVVRAFLRCIGEQFSDVEVRAGMPEPIDIVFRSARFQLMDIVGDKKRGREWTERERRYYEATRVFDLLESWSDSKPISFDEISQRIATALAEKASRYGAATCSRLDALVYVDSGGAHLWPLASSSGGAESNELKRHGWRSASMLFIPYGAVLTAASDAPDFLKGRLGCVLNEWPSPDGWFDP